MQSRQPGEHGYPVTEEVTCIPWVGTLRGQCKWPTDLIDGQGGERLDEWNLELIEIKFHLYLIRDDEGVGIDIR